MMRFSKGSQAIFTRYTQATDIEQDLAAHSGQVVTVEPLDPARYDVEDVGPMYHVKFEDGFEAEAFEDELTPTK